VTLVLTVRVELSRSRLLRRFDAVGHAGAGLGRNIACAAATVLLRTADHACRDLGMVERRAAARSGELAVHLRKATDGRDEWLRGVTDFLVRGMSDLQLEFPDQIALQVETTED